MYFCKNEKRRTTGAYSSSLPIICRFSISGALPQLFHPTIFLGHCPSFFALPHFWGNSTHAKKSEVLTSNGFMVALRLHRSAPTNPAFWGEPQTPGIKLQFRSKQSSHPKKSRQLAELLIFAREASEPSFPPPSDTNKADRGIDPRTAF